jgi:hypothetical protein
VSYANSGSAIGFTASDLCDNARGDNDQRSLDQSVCVAADTSNVCVLLHEQAVAAVVAIAANPIVL